MLMVTTAFGAEGEPSADPVKAAFEKLDADGDGQLSLEEYVQRSEARNKNERDFQVFDFDGDERLTRSEFAAIPGLVPPAQRGALPDPFEALLNAAVAAMDETYNHWDRQPRLMIPTQQFIVTFMESIAPDGVLRSFDRSWMPQADPEGNGQVSRQEAKRFLEIQLGLRATTGEPLHDPQGRVLMMRHFHWMDLDKDNRISREEFLTKWHKLNQPEAFAQGDRDHDGFLTLDEYSHPDWLGYEDPVTMFLGWDKNLDGALDADEIKKSAPDYLASLVPNTLPAFDLDGDGKLSLNEFRVSMMGNRVFAWNTVPVEKNRDRLLTFDEFVFTGASCDLLRRFYFSRLDRNEDNRLSLDEYPFKVKAPHAIYFLAADGREFRQLFASEDYPNCGSPAVSPDGQRIAFDGYHGGQTLQQSRILLINSDGGGLKDLCEGLMPTWSKDGRQLACSRYTGGSGVWIINVDGTGEKRIGDGWGAQWSPDGKLIAYTQGNAIWVYDVERGESREVMGAGEHPFQSLYYNMDWSPDSRRLAFRAVDNGRDAITQSVVASVSMAGAARDLQTHFTTPLNLNPDLCWTPDGRHLLFSLHSNELKHNVIHRIEVGTKGPPEIVKGIDRSLKFTSITRAPTGFIVVTQD